MRISKKFFLTTAFAALLGVGAFVGVSSSKNIEKADAVSAGGTVYCKMTHDWWKAEGAAIGAYFFNSETKQSHTSWPGTRMSSVSGETDTWSITYPTGGYDTVIFVRVNGTGSISDWGAQTADLTIPTDTKNFFTITNSSPTWGGNPGCNGTWSNYHSANPSSTKNQFYVFDPHTVLGSTLSNINVYGYGQATEIKPMSWPGTHDGVTSATLGITPMYSVSLSVSYPNANINCGNDNNQTNDLTSVSSHSGQVLVIKSGHTDKVFETEWVSASTFNGSGNYPASTGYYVVNSTNSYSFTGSTKMTSATSPYVAKVTSFSASEGLGIKVRGFYNDRENPNIWSFYAGDTEIFGSPDGDANFIFTKTIVVDIYAKYVSGELKFYVLEHVDDADLGYYILGNDKFAQDHGSSATEWTFASGLKMNSLDGGENRASYVLTVTQTVEIRVRECLSLDHGWLNFGRTYDGTDGIKTIGSNVEILEGTYTLYVNSEGSTYILKGIPLDAFCTQFLAVINDVCEDDGSTSTSRLYSAWSDLGDLYASVLSSEKPTIVNIGFNGGSNVDDPHRVVKAYHYIVVKYGTANCNDFIWNQNITGTYNASRLLVESISKASSTAFVVISVAVVTLAAAGGYFLFRKKKED